MNCRLFIPSPAARLMWVGLLLAGMWSGTLSSADADPTAPLWRVAPAGESLKPSVEKPLRTYNDAYHPWAPPENAEAWSSEAAKIREQLLVSQGLWPMPPKIELQPVIHGLIDEGDYTVEKVFFASLPGHYVTGNLYRPKNGAEKRPGVLCPHGHWANGRFVSFDDAAVKKELESGAEPLESGARSPVQARMVHLARMGCTVFHYDMVGYADSTSIPHRSGFTDAESGLRLQNFMGLQTFNSIRALDFLMSLPEVDHDRVAVTGASGGGTQTFVLCAIDERPDVAFPAVMVGTAMQGGCICENSPYLRHSLNNVAFAALTAPRPLALSGANDWTIDIETKGLPELKTVFGFFNASGNVHATCYPQFGHNYNGVARRMMYAWMKEHLALAENVSTEERDFRVLSNEEMSVFDAEHPLPEDAASAEGVREWLTEVNDDALQALLPQDESELAEYREVIGTAAKVLLDAQTPLNDVETTVVRKSELNLDDVAMSLEAGVVRRSDSEIPIPYIRLVPDAGSKASVLWIDGDGKQALFTDDGAPLPAVRKLLSAGYEFWSADVRGTGELLQPGEAVTSQPVDERYGGYTFCYNAPLIAKRTSDIRAVWQHCTKTVGTEGDVPVTLVGSGAAGPWCLLAATVCEPAPQHVVSDLNGFEFAKITRTDDPDYLPGALKYGGLSGLGALTAPMPSTLFGADPAAMGDFLQVHQVAGTARLQVSPASATPELIVAAILKK